MINNDWKSIQGIINQYEYDMDNEFDVKAVDDIKDETKRNETFCTV